MPEKPLTAYQEAGVEYPPAPTANRYAMRAFSHPAAIAATVEAVTSEVQTYIDAVGLDRTLVEVQHIGNRALFHVTSAPLFYLAEVAADKYFLRGWSNNRLNTEAYGQNLPAASPSDYPFEGAYKEYRDVEAAVNRQSALEVVQAVSQPEHPYHPVWQAYNTAHPVFAATDYAIRGWKRSADPGMDFVSVFESMPEVNMSIVMMKVALSIRRNKDLGGVALTQALLRRYEEIAWQSTLSRRTIVHQFPVAGQAAGTSPSCPFSAENPNLLMQSVQDNMPLWTRPDIKGGPRKASSFCPMSSNVALHSDDPEVVSVVEDIYTIPEQFGAKRHTERPKGTGYGSELHTIRTIALLGETVFRGL